MYEDAIKLRLKVQYFYCTNIFFKFLNHVISFAGSRDKGDSLLQSPLRNSLYFLEPSTLK